VTQRTLILVVVIGGLVSVACPSASARPQAKKDPSPDNELLEELDIKLLDELDRELFQPDRKPAAPGVRGPKAKTPGEGPDEPDRRIEPAGGKYDNPLLEIARQMRQVETQISRADSGSQTQGTQRRIAANLQELIDELRRSCRQSQPSQGDSQAVAARKPAGRPTEKKPPPGRKKAASKLGKTGRAKPGKADARRPEEGRVQAVLKDLWGELPQHAREQMLQLPAEKFLPEYELMIEEYFKRLVEEEGAGTIIDDR